MNKTDKLSLKLEDIKKVFKGNNYFESNDGYIYFPSSSNSSLLISKDDTDYKRLKFDNVKEILYIGNEKYIFLNTDNKIEMHTEYDSLVLDYTIDSMDEIFDFVSY